MNPNAIMWNQYEINKTLVHLKNTETTVKKYLYNLVVNTPSSVIIQNN